MKPCSVPGCTRSMNCHSLCSMHWSRVLRDGTPGEPQSRVIYGESLESKVARCVAGAKRTALGCLEPPLWVSRHPSGCARITWNQQTWPLPRAAWTVRYGPIPKGLFVCHHCDNPLCFDVENHLYLGTPMDNVQDKVSRGRMTHLVSKLGTRLDPTITIELVRMVRDGQQSVVIRRTLGVSKRTVARYRAAFASEVPVRKPSLSEAIVSELQSKLDDGATWKEAAEATGLSVAVAQRYAQGTRPDLGLDESVRVAIVELDRQGLSISAIAETLGINWRTARKYCPSRT